MPGFGHGKMTELEEAGRAIVGELVKTLKIIRLHVKMYRTRL